MALVRVTFTFSANYDAEDQEELDQQVRRTKRAMHIEEATTTQTVLDGRLEGRAPK